MKVGRVVGAEGVPNQDARTPAHPSRKAFFQVTPPLEPDGNEDANEEGGSGTGSEPFVSTEPSPGEIEAAEPATKDAPEIGAGKERQHHVDVEF